MIFRRSNEAVSTARKPQPMDRREPSLAARQTNNAPLPGPVSPHAVAQNRRSPAQQAASTPANHFSGKDQSRKLTVGRDISLNGEIATCDHLVVEGTVKATIKGGKVLEISETGSFSGVVDIEHADIAGRFEGELIVRGKLIIRPTADVTGALYYNRLQVDTGATINAQLGTLETEQEESQTPPAETTLYQTPSNAVAEPVRNLSLASLNDEPGFLRANAG